jgi:oligoribonuclease (3'-5' exoribonuclease)
MTTPPTPTTTSPAPLLLWCDFETDRLDIAKLDILEACFVLTTTDLVELSRFTTLVRPRIPLVEVVEAMPDEVRDMHHRSGLLDALFRADITGEWMRTHDVQWPVLDMIDRATDVDGTLPVALAGAGVAGFDRHVIRTWLSQLDVRLTCWCVDTSAVDRFGNLFAGIDRQPGDAAHRAEADVDEAIRTAKVWRARMTSPAWTGAEPRRVIADRDVLHDAGIS